MFITIITFIIILSILILVHELGHFLVARKNGILVEEFGLGLPPRIWGKKIGETLYSVNWLPFGGFVKLHGENFGDEILDPNRAFINKSKKVRSAVLTAGVIMNFLLGIFAFAIGYSVGGIPRETKNVRVLEVVIGSPAQTAGLTVGDVIRKVDGVDISTTETFIGLINQKRGKAVFLTVERESAGTKTLEIKVVPRANPPAGEGPLGVTVSATEIYFPPLFLRPLVGAYYGLKDALFWGKNVILGFVKIFKDLASGKAPTEVSGPVGIFAVTTQAAKYGILSLVNFVGILSINLAILNIFPFPALDGGRLLFVVIEGVVGKKVEPKIESYIHTVGMIILLILILAITLHDIQGLISAGSISKFLDGVR